MSWLRCLSFQFIPGNCLLCGDTSGRNIDLCRDCEADLPVIRRACPYCALPLPTTSPCFRCRARRPATDRVTACFIYRTPISQMISRLKEGEDHVMGRVLADAILRRVQKPDTDALLPVPGRPERAFDHAANLARHLADAWSLPLLQSLRRNSASTPQKSLSRDSRRRNIRGAFHSQESCHGKRITIIDDVVTTAATINEIARVLKASGAQKVDVIAVARTPAKPVP